MATRTLTLSDLLQNLDTTPRVGVPISVSLLTPGGVPVTDLEGGVLLNGQQFGETTTTDATGRWSLTAVYPGDLRDGDGNALTTPCQLVVVEGGVQTLSPLGFAYAASITVSTWYPLAVSAAGMLPMLVDLRLLSNAADQGATIQFGITATAVAPNGTSLDASQNVPISTDAGGNAVIPNWPSAGLNPATTTYTITFPDGTIWYYLAPALPTGYQGAYNAGTTYHPNAGTKASPADVVLSGGVYYQCIAATTGNAPPNATYWQVWAGEPIVWHLTQITTPGGVVIATTGVAASPTLAALADDPINPALTLDDDLVILAARAGLALRTLTASATLLDTDDYVVVDATAGSITLTLMAATTRVRPLTIIRKDASANTVTMSRAGADLINGAASLSLDTQYLWAVLKPDTVASWYAQTGTGGGTSVITTEGDLIVGNSSGLATRLPLGLPGQMVSPVGSDADWITPSGIPGHAGAADLTRAEGDLLYRKTTAVTALVLGFIGDSITAGAFLSAGQDPPSQAVAALSSNLALTITDVNQGVGGTSTGNWISGSTNLTNAKAAFVAAGVRVVHIMLGTNDAFPDGSSYSAATYLANLRSLVNDLIQSGYLVMLSYPPYVVPGAQGGSWFAGADTALLSMQTQINRLVNGRNIFLGDTSAYLYFAAHTSQLSDGVHPIAAGAAWLGGTAWANALTPVVLALSEQVTLQQLPIGSGGQVLTVAGGYPSWQTGGGGFANPMTAQDDLILGGTAGAPTRLAKGAAGQVLTTNAGTGHVDWENSAAGFANPMTTAGDLISGGAGGAAGRLAVGSAGAALQVVGGVPAWAALPIYAPVVTGALPGPTAVATSDGKFIMARIS